MFLLFMSLLVGDSITKGILIDTGPPKRTGWSWFRSGVEKGLAHLSTLRIVYKMWGMNSPSVSGEQNR